MVLAFIRFLISGIDFLYRFTCHSLMDMLMEHQRSSLMRGGMLFQTGGEAFVKLCELLFLVLFEGFDYFEIRHFKIFFITLFYYCIFKGGFYLFFSFLLQELAEATPSMVVLKVDVDKAPVCTTLTCRLLLEVLKV